MKRARCGCPMTLSQEQWFVLHTEICRVEMEAHQERLTKQREHSEGIER